MFKTFWPIHKLKTLASELSKTTLFYLKHFLFRFKLLSVVTRTMGDGRRKQDILDNGFKTTLPKTFKTF